MDEELETQGLIFRTYVKSGGRKSLAGQRHDTDGDPSSFRLPPCHSEVLSCGHKVDVELPDMITCQAERKGQAFFPSKTKIFLSKKGSCPWWASAQYLIG